jgi:hypothetical protein
LNDFRATVDSVRDRIDLVALVGRDVELRPSGAVLKGSSPFRPDSDPSFVVWPHSQTWRSSPATPRPPSRAPSPRPRSASTPIRPPPSARASPWTR